MAPKRTESDNARSPLRDLIERGEEVVNVFLEELTGGANLRDEIEGAVVRANRARKTVDKNMEAVLAALNLPTRSDYKRLVEEIHALQGSVVNLNMKLDRLMAQTAAAAAKSAPAPPVTPAAKAKPKPRKSTGKSRVASKMGRGKPRIRTKTRKRAASS